VSHLGRRTAIRPADFAWSAAVQQIREGQSVRGSLPFGSTQPREKRRPILVVDDDPAIRTTIADILGLEGYEVETAANGLEALNSVTDHLPAVVVLDMRMPIMDGWTFARELQTRGIKLPIVVITAAQNARTWAQEIGADAYLAKPFELNDLLDAVERLQQRPPAGAMNR
jgi:CheY-like chemotaxis protein